MPRLVGNEYPMVMFAAFQDVNQDDVVDETVLGPDIVFSNLNKPDVPVYTAPPPEGVVGAPGTYSIWSQRGGGPAEAYATLVAISWKGGKESIRTLATTGPFHIGG